MSARFFTRQFTYQWIPAARHVPLADQRVMIVLHGRADSLRPFRSIGEELRIPQFNYLLINAPRKYDGGFTWYAFEPNQGTGILAARAKLTALLGDLHEQGWDSRKIYLYGFSQGCVVSCDLAMSYPRPLGGVIGISGYVFLFPKWQRTVTAAAFHTPWLITHGTLDDAIDLQFAEASVNHLTAVGLPIQFKKFKKGHEIDEEHETKFIRRWLKPRLPEPKSPLLKYPLEIQAQY